MLVSPTEDDGRFPTWMNGRDGRFACLPARGTTLFAFYRAFLFHGTLVLRLPYAVIHSPHKPHCSFKSSTFSGSDIPDHALPGLFSACVAVTAFRHVLSSLAHHYSPSFSSAPSNVVVWVPFVFLLVAVLPFSLRVVSVQFKWFVVWFVLPPHVHYRAALTPLRFLHISRYSRFVQVAARFCCCCCSRCGAAFTLLACTYAYGFCRAIAHYLLLRLPVTWFLYTVAFLRYCRSVVRLHHLRLPYRLYRY